MLRTLTLKSELKFGKFADYRVEQILQIKKFDYLVWVYFNSSNITFMPEILQTLGITHLINKPGVDKDYYEKYRKLQIEEFKSNRQVLTVEQASFYKHKAKKNHQHQIIQSDKQRHLSKADLMYKNRR